MKQAPTSTPRAIRSLFLDYLSAIFEAVSCHLGVSFMITVGIDSGSQNTEAVILQGKTILGSAQVPSGFDAHQAAVVALEKRWQWPAYSESRFDLSQLLERGEI